MKKKIDYTSDGKEIIKKGKHQFYLINTFTTMVLSSEKEFIKQKLLKEKK